MSIESDLKRDGIEVIDKLDTSKVNSIAKKIAFDLCSAFPNFNLNENDLFFKLSQLNMYTATMPKDISEATYCYKNSSIYFKKNTPYKKLEEFAVHECIHYLQEVKDNKNYLVRMGLCDYSKLKIYGLGLNEAAVQLMTSKVIKTKKEFVKYFNISFETNSPNYYPLECCLVNQLAYLVGENILFESTLLGNDNFKEKLIELTDYPTFMKIQNSIDKIAFLEEKIAKISNKIIKIDDRHQKVDDLINQINSIKNSITSVFINTQNLIISSYFDKQFNYIYNFEGIENYRKRLYKFKNYLGSTDGYSYFNNYYVNKMIALDEKYSLLKNGITSNPVYLIEKKETKFSMIIKYLKKILKINSLEQLKNYND